MKNISSVKLESVELYVILLDSSGRPQASDNALIEYGTLLPGQESPWKTYVDYNPELLQFRFEFHDFRTRNPIPTRDDRPPESAFSVVQAPTSTPAPWSTAVPPTAVPTVRQSTTGYSSGFDYDREIYDPALRWLKSAQPLYPTYIAAACAEARTEVIPDAGLTFVALFNLLVTDTANELDPGSLNIPAIANAYGKALLDHCNA